MNNLAERIKESVTMIEVARYYGIQVDRHGMACCPFHKEKTASLKIYPGKRGFHCFGCGAGGDVISFVQKLFDLPFQDAVAKLDEDFHLGLNVRRDLTDSQRIREAFKNCRQDSDRQKRDLALQAAKDAHELAAKYWTVLDLIRSRTKPPRPDSLDDDALAALDFSDAYAAALHMLPAAEYLLERAEVALYEAERLST